MEFSNFTVSVLGLFKKRFEVYEYDVLSYYVKQSSIFNTRRFLLQDINGDVAFEIYRPSFFNMGRFEIIEDGSVVADIQKEVIKNHFYMSSADGNYAIKSNLMNAEYNIFKEDREIGICSRKRFKNRGRYGVSIQQNELTDILIAFVLCVAIANQLRRQSG